MRGISILQSNVVSDAPIDGGAVRFDTGRPRISPIPSSEGQHDYTIPRSDPEVTRVLYRPQRSASPIPRNRIALRVREAELRRSEGKRASHHISAMDCEVNSVYHGLQGPEEITSDLLNGRGALERR